MNVPPAIIIAVAVLLSFVGSGALVLMNKDALFEEKARTSYVKADGEEKSLTNLKERRQEDHFQFELKKEERELEDVITARYGLKPTT